MGGKKALCVGINEYMYKPDSRLRGCVNDAMNMAAIFRTYLGFADKDITMLYDGQATKANIMRNLHAMVEGAKAGKYDHLAFSLSCHGSQIPDLDGDEIDLWDEAFCPTDLQPGKDTWDPDHIIKDDELHDLFAGLPAGTRLDVYLDTCHSGTGIKALDMTPDRVAKYIPPPSYGPFKEVDEIRSRPKRGHRYGKCAAKPTLWAACRSNQTSSDAPFEREHHGAFTYFLCKEINACDNAISDEELLARVKRDLKAARFLQTPQLEKAALDRVARPA